MAVISTPLQHPAIILSTLQDLDMVGLPKPVRPTERWDGKWSAGQVTSSTNVYGLYVRSIRLSKWLDREVRDLLERYPREVGRGTLESGPEDGLAPFTVRGSGDDDPLGDWVLLYVGISDSKTPRIVQYFGTTNAFTREPGGQSLHLSLALFFGGGSDPRDSPEPPARSVEGLLRASLGLRL
jgi:hypothetical protein